MAAGDWDQLRIISNCGLWISDFCYRSV